MAESNSNLWAPWRMQYIHSIGEEEGCFLCRYAQAPARDADNHVLWRSERSLTLLNRFPYTGGHLLIAPLEHEAELEALSEPVLLELTLRVRDAKRVLTKALGPQGFNIGMNVGRCAGAGLPDHLHWHIVPRWAGDTNFVPVVGDVRVIPEFLNETYERLRAAARELSF